MIYDIKYILKWNPHRAPQEQVKELDIINLKNTQLDGTINKF